MSKYSETFQSTETARNYEEVVYNEKTHDFAVWEMQKNVVCDAVAAHPGFGSGLKHLDFACGTGRVLAVVEELTGTSVGLDISREMLELAGKKVKKAQLLAGDILKQQAIVDTDYDVITTFRFFLNTEPQMRDAVIASLGGRLRDKNSRLIFNVQGNSESLRHLALKFRPVGVQTHNEMSLRDVQQLVGRAGLEIEHWYGFGLLPPVAYRGIFRELARRIDRGAAQLGLMRRFSYDLLFVCKPS